MYFLQTIKADDQHPASLLSHVEACRGSCDSTKQIYFLGHVVFGELRYGRYLPACGQEWKIKICGVGRTMPRLVPETVTCIVAAPEMVLTGLHSGGCRPIIKYHRNHRKPRTDWGYTMPISW